MKKILVYVTPDEIASLFDIIAGYDATSDAVIPYTSVDENLMHDIVHECVFTRSYDNLRNTAIFIGGRNYIVSEQLMKKAEEVMSDLPDILRVSIALDPAGAYTTAAACVAKIADNYEISKANATVLAGTGPVGENVAMLLSNEGATVTLTSRSTENATATVTRIKKRYGIKIHPSQTKTPNQIGDLLSTSDIVLSTGSEGVEIVSEEVWSKCDNIDVLADCNAVPPYGICGVKPTDNGKVRTQIRFGAIAIGKLKMKIHHHIVKNLFKSKNSIYDLEMIYSATKQRLKQKR